MKATRTIAVAVGVRQWLALLASVTAHLALLCLIDAAGAGGSAPAPRKAEPAILSVRLAAGREADMTQETNAFIPDRHDEAILQRLQERPPAAQRPADRPAPMFEVVTPPEPRYHSARELTEKTRGSLEVPAEVAAALDAESPHVARLRLLINEFGLVDRVITDDSSFSDADLQKLLAAFREKQFEPGKIDGIAVKSELAVEITNGK